MQKLKNRTLANVQSEIEKLKTDIRANNRRILQLEKCKERETCEGCHVECLK